MKKISPFVLAGLLVVLFSCNRQVQEELTKPQNQLTHAQNTITAEEKADGFVLIFDGKTSDGWRGFQKDYFPERWIVEDGTLHFSPKTEGARGDIVVDKLFSDFHLIPDKHVKHIQNGEVVVEYEYGTEAWNELVAGSKFPGLNPDWAKLQEEGYIGLQDHNDKVWYRNIKIKEL